MNERFILELTREQAELLQYALETHAERFTKAYPKNATHWEREAFTNGHQKIAELRRKLYEATTEPEVIRNVTKEITERVIARNKKEEEK